MLTSIALGDLFNLFGSSIAFILLALKIIEYRRDKIKLDIDLNLLSFSTIYPNEESRAYGSVEDTYVSIIADIKNTGRQPTTVSKIVLFSDNENFSDLKMFNELENKSQFSALSYTFIPIRVEANDRIEMKIFTSKNIYLENFESMNCTIEFTTSHKVITKRLKVTEKRA
ncbi:hypothetical protein [Methanococcoides sp. AM1]|uniref:hypothetical protein n=1 Tax=Methanococcoides sp. AM1 TaxID=1201011 RepID=UPI0010838E78|nr:hypothetical protein [Methanococcoides sp. AM1]